MLTLNLPSPEIKKLEHQRDILIKACKLIQERKTSLLNELKLMGLDEKISINWNSLHFLPVELMPDDSEKCVDDTKHPEDENHPDNRRYLRYSNYKDKDNIYSGFSLFSKNL